jgi:signal transduction histidine kinase
MAVGHAALLNLRLDGSDDWAGFRDQAHAESALLRQTLELVQDGVAITAPSPQGRCPRILFANAAFRAMAGCPDGYASVGDIDAVEATLPEASAIWTKLKESHQSESVYSADVDHRRADGETLRLGLRSEPLRNESGQITHRIAVFRDGTDLAWLEEAVRRNERLACIGLLAAGIAHEINNPTGSALLAAETALSLMGSKNADEHVAACLRNIVASMDRCGRIVRTLLRYSRQEPTEKQACSINDVAEQALDLARPYAGSHGARLRLDVDPSIPLVPMNPLEIELVLLNLLRNAVEAGRGNVEIVVGTASTENGVRVAVRDNGCGMSKEQIVHVFDPLFTTRRHQGGSGLGMSIAFGIVQEHQGRMEITSQEGKGTTVTIDLPVAASPLENSGKQGQDSYGSNSNRGE